MSAQRTVTLAVESPVVTAVADTFDGAAGAATGIVTVLASEEIPSPPAAVGTTPEPVGGLFAGSEPDQSFDIRGSLPPGLTLTDFSDGHFDGTIAPDAAGRDFEYTIIHCISGVCGAQVVIDIHVLGATTSTVPTTTPSTPPAATPVDTAATFTG